MVFRNSIGDDPSESTSLHQNPSNVSRKGLDCCSQWDGFTVISSCFFMMTLAITFALALQIHYGSPEVTPHGAVATDEPQCSEVGISLMREGGNAVDVVLSSLVCLSVTHPHLVGPGGGGVILVHDHKKNMSKVFDFMSGVPHLLPYPMSLQPNDGRSIGVPGFLRGLKSVHNKYGVLPWKKIFEPSIKLAREGFTLSSQLKENREYSREFKKVFPKQFIVTEGQNLMRPRYAKFLEDIAEEGPDELYLLKYGVELIEALKKAGSKVSVSDLHNYKVREEDVFITRLQHFDLITAGLPFGGLQTIAGLDYLNKSKVNLATSSKVLYHEFAESMHYGAAKLVEAVKASSQNDAYVTDNLWILPDQPAAQVSSVDAFDLYVSAIVGLGTSFGSQIITEHEIILNNHLYSNFKNAQFNIDDTDKKAFHGRPFTSYTPFILIDHNNVCGNRIVLSSSSSSAVLQAIAQILFRNLDMTPSIQEPRIAFGRNESILKFDDEEPSIGRLSAEVRDYLSDNKYIFELLNTPLSVNGVSKNKDLIVSHSDTRGGGLASRLSGIVEAGTKEKTNHSSPLKN